jgi:DNA-binding NarL/FixJ family response regulator
MRISPIRILVVDDYDVVQLGLRVLLGREAWAERCLPARNGVDAVTLALRYAPEVALVSATLGRENGLDICARLCELPRPPRILLSARPGSVDPETVRRVGAAGIVNRDWPVRRIADALRIAAGGGTPAGGARPAPLSARERQILAQIATGATNSQIAERLVISPHTVKDHASAVYRKLGVRNRAEAVQQAQRMGLVA